MLDGTLIACDRLTGVRENGNDLWVSHVEPGSTPDITSARNHVLPALYKAAADRLPTLADKAYIGAGSGYTA
ncbi:hypothetical protein [Streptomyces olivochromogenes]|uniref:hypothetical protein n=1 Tax=Streptomyces olivochromogenes TaxID=1963 RepID=UPI0035B04288|nr:hypothetical protein [Streptomyces olivochromogenes]